MTDRTEIRDEIERIAVSIPTACKMTSIGRTRLYELLASGEIEFVRVGRRGKRPVVASLREWVRKHTERAGGNCGSGATT